MNELDNALAPEELYVYSRGFQPAIRDVLYKRAAVSLIKSTNRFGTQKMQLNRAISLRHIILHSISIKHVARELTNL